MSKSIGVAEVKRHFSDVIIEVAREGGQFIIEKKRRETNGSTRQYKGS
jgi:antitoxin (DNA-binding transcriptional repressor) of toxin-antitoxin stability system